MERVEVSDAAEHCSYVPVITVCKHVRYTSAELVQFDGNGANQSNQPSPNSSTAIQFLIGTIENYSVHVVVILDLPHT